MVHPWRTIKGAEPDAIKVASPVLNGRDEETYRKATRLVPTQLPRSGFRARLKPGVRLSVCSLYAEGNLLRMDDEFPYNVWRIDVKLCLTVSQWYTVSHGEIFANSFRIAP